LPKIQFGESIHENSNIILATLLNNFRLILGESGGTLIYDDWFDGEYDDPRVRTSISSVIWLIYLTSKLFVLFFVLNMSIVCVMHAFRIAES